MFRAGIHLRRRHRIPFSRRSPQCFISFNPFPESGLQRTLANLEQSLRQNPRPVYVLYHNPLLEHVLRESAAFTKVGGTHQYSIYSIDDSPGKTG